MVNLYVHHLCKGNSTSEENKKDSVLTLKSTVKHLKSVQLLSHQHDYNPNETEINNTDTQLVLIKLLFSLNST